MTTGAPVAESAASRRAARRPATRSTACTSIAARSAVVSRTTTSVTKPPRPPQPPTAEQRAQWAAERSGPRSETPGTCPECGETTGRRGTCVCAPYSALEVHFSLVHWGDVEAIALARSPEQVRDTREAYRREYEILPSGRICICKPDETLSTAAAGGMVRPSARTPEILYLDVQRAYSALPMHWEGRTAASLMMGRARGVYVTEAAIESLRQSGRFTNIHRRRIAWETFRATSGAGLLSIMGGAELPQPTTWQPRRQDQERETMAPWDWMARFLNGQEAAFAPARGELGKEREHPCP